MNVIKGKTVRLMMAVYNNTLIHLHVLTDITSCDKYIRFLVYSNDALDIIFKFDDAPGFVQYLFNYLSRNNKISLSEDTLSYIIQGPSIKSGCNVEIFRLAQIFIIDYNKILTQIHEFMYDHDVSKTLAEKTLRPIYNTVVSNNVSCPATVPSTAPAPSSI
jgi:hypothetical protein